MEANNRNRTIAVAALFQAVEGVTQIASKGQVDDDLFASCVGSILHDADTAEGLYGGLSSLKAGFQVLLYQLGGSRLTPDGKPKDMESTRYAVNLLYLEKKLSADRQAFAKVLEGIEGAQQQLEFFDETHPNMVARLAEVYTSTVSKIGPRIIIKGDQSYLANPDNAAKIRVLLLAGIRAGLLWRQAGGSRWKLLFARGRMQNEARAILKNINQQAFNTDPD